MSSFQSVLTDIFDRSGERRYADVQEERDAIALAKRGDQDATVGLMYAYAATLRNAVSGSASSSDRSDLVEDLRQESVVGLLKAIEAFDPDVHHRLAAIVSQYVADAVSAAAALTSGFAVPERTLKRFFSILRKAQGNIYDAAALAPQHEMTTETFLAVLGSVRNVDSYSAADSGREEGSDDLLSVWDSAAPLVGKARTDSEIVEDAVLVKAAFRAVDDLEADVVALAYGFADYDPQPDAETAIRLGLSRPKVQRVRTAALGKMRLALGA